MNKEISEFVSIGSLKILEAAKIELTDIALEYLEDYIGMSETADAEHVKNGFDVPQGQPMQNKSFHAMVRCLVRGEIVDDMVPRYAMAVRVAEIQVGKAIEEYKASMT